MPKFRCPREALSVSGDQEFEVEADSVEEAIEMFKDGKGKFVASDCEVTQLGPYDFDSVWEEK